MPAGGALPFTPEYGTLDDAHIDAWLLGQQVWVDFTELMNGWSPEVMDEYNTHAQGQSSAEVGTIEGAGLFVTSMPADRQGRDTIDATPYLSWGITGLRSVGFVFFAFGGEAKPRKVGDLLAFIEPWRPNRYRNYSQVPASAAEELQEIYAAQQRMIELLKIISSES